MKIAVFATGPVGLAVVRHFHEQHQELACVAVAENDPRADEIRELQVYRNLRCCTNADLRTPETLEMLRKQDLDLVILAWWPHIIKDELMQLPRHGFLNFHPSLLPHNRGKHPNFWAIIEGCPYGVSLHFIDHNIDGGDIAFQHRLNIDWQDTGATLYARAQNAIIDLFKEHFDEIVAGRIPHAAQADGGSFHPSREIDPICELDLARQMSVRELLNLLRARTFRRTRRTVLRRQCHL
jgi:methionyl-tRNA formyltransferase